MNLIIKGCENLTNFISEKQKKIWEVSERNINN